MSSNQGPRSQQATLCGTTGLCSPYVPESPKARTGSMMLTNPISAPHHWSSRELQHLGPPSACGGRSGSHTSHLRHEARRQGHDEGIHGPAKDPRRFLERALLLFVPTVYTIGPTALNSASASLPLDHPKTFWFFCRIHAFCTRRSLVSYITAPPANPICF